MVYLLPYPEERDAPCLIRSVASLFGISASAYFSAHKFGFLLFAEFGIFFGVISALDSLINYLAKLVKVNFK